MELGEFSLSAPSVKYTPQSNQKFKNGRCNSVQFNTQVLTVNSCKSQNHVYKEQNVTLRGKTLAMDLMYRVRSEVYLGVSVVVQRKQT